MRTGRRRRGPVSHITLAEKEIGLINEEKSSTSHETLERTFFRL